MAVGTILANERSMRKSRRSRAQRSSLAPIVLGAAAVAAGSAFALLARAAYRRQTLAADDKLRRELTPPESHPLRTITTLAPIGKWYAYVPAAVGIASSVLRKDTSALERKPQWRNRQRGALAVVSSGVASFALTELFDRVLPQPPSPPGHPPGKPVFPSGHTFGPLAVGLASSYVLGRERMLSPAISVPAAMLIPLVSAATRFVDEKHWSSDVAGGVLGGVAVAGAILAAYELARDA